MDGTREINSLLKKQFISSNGLVEILLLINKFKQSGNLKLRKS